MPDGSITLDDKYTASSDRVYLTGTQALVRLLMEQQRRDRAAGLRTAGYVTGYRGSPLGGFDMALGNARRFLDAHDIRFQPGLNEDLAATALWGTQQVHLFDTPEWDGVFGVWYGKGPGVDRSGDAFRHANLAGTAPKGGVLLLAGDDHTCKSSTTSHHSEYALVDAMIPVLHPATVDEILEYGLHGFALSRFAGCWAGMKVTADLTDRTVAVGLDPSGPRIVLPADHPVPPGGFGIRWPDTPQEQEARLHLHKIPAVLAYLRANRLDRIAFGRKPARLGIATTGKACLDVRQALAMLGIDEARAQALGIAVYKVACTWPLETEGLRAFAEGLDELLVVEEKRPLIETQVKDALYNLPADRRPRVTGKADETGAPLLRSHDELSPSEIARVLAARVERLAPGSGIAEALARLPGAPAVEAAPKRPAYFCSGCPHSSSTRVPEGSRALAGIGCHYLAQGMERRTDTYTHMGAEGANWIGQAPFVPTRHIFQNIGDGTFFHSGLLAVRAAVAAGVTMTYKILFNDAVAMTGGQRHDGQLTPQAIAWQVRAEGVQRIAVVTDQPEKYGPGAGFPPSTTIHHRDDLDAVQRELREVPGVSALVYDQTCATEKRRRRKRGLMEDPNRRVFINERVCEGCGDCSRASNCVSVVPLETEFGTKRQIDQSSCNKDESCLNGFCPSFVTVEGGTFKRASAAAAGAPPAAALPVPAVTADRSCDILVTGVGGTGIVTVGAILGMAAHLDGCAFSVLDQTGLAQKGGAVMSHIRLAPAGTEIPAARIPDGGADVVLGCDLLVAAGADGLARMAPGRTRAVLNRHETITGDFTRHSDARLDLDGLVGRVKAACGADAVDAVNAIGLATALLGDSIAANLFLVGFAWQRGLIPLSAGAIDRAIELNGTAVAMNRAAFAWGRCAAADLASVEAKVAAKAAPQAPRQPLDLDELVRRREELLTAYQDAAYAARYRRLVDRVRTAEARAVAGSTRLTEAVARNLAKLMAYKDEYEVARLHSDGEFLARLKERYEGSPRLRFHLAPPLLAPRDPVTGLPRKQVYGPWMLHAFRVLAKLKRLRGTPFDIFGRTAERRMERRLIAQYEAGVEELIERLQPGTLDLAVRIASLPDRMRGFGHVKEEAVRKAEAEKAALMAQLRKPALAAAE